MIWFLIFCTEFSNNTTTVCSSPVQMPTQSACQFIGEQQTALVHYGLARFRCVGVRAGKDKP